MKLYIANIKEIPRRILLSLCNYLLPSVSGHYEDLPPSDLAQMLISFFYKLLDNENYEEIELENKLLSRLSAILQVSNNFANKEQWIKDIQLALGKKILDELEPMLEIAHYISWADGNFSVEELEVMDLLFSQMKLLKPFKNEIVRYCINPIPLSTLKSDLARFKRDGQKTEMLLSFAWAMAFADDELDEREYSAYNVLCDILEVSSVKRAEIMNKVEQKWKKLRNSGVANLAEAVVEAANVSEYVDKISGLDAFEKLNGKHVTLKKHSVIADQINSLTLISKIGIINDPSLNAIDRAVLITSIVLSEV